MALLDDIVAGAYHVEDLQPEDYRRTREICDRYADADVGFVDAAVLAVVERLNEPKLATLDSRHVRVSTAPPCGRAAAGPWRALAWRLAGAVPLVEAIIALVLVNHRLRQRGQVRGSGG